MDPVEIAKRQEAEGRLPFIYPKLFETRYREQADGSVKSEDWVVIAKKGVSIPDETPYRWKDILRDPGKTAVLKPFYDNWKAGQQPPTTGTPLDAWMSDAELTRVLNSVNVRSVEDFAEMADHLIVRLNIPSIREKQKRARAFLEAQKDTAKVSAEVAKVKGENEDLRREISELRALIEQHAVKKDEEQTQVEVPAAVRRARGRPRKNPEAIQ